MPEPDHIEVRPVDLGRDVVAQQQPDGRLIVAVRPYPAQSYAHAVDRVREAVEKATNRPISADSVRRLLRPHWPEQSRASVDSLLGDPARAADAVQSAGPPPVSISVPLRRRNVQLGTVGAGVGLVLATLLVQSVLHDHPTEVVTAPFTGPVFEVFEDHGGRCTDNGPGHGTCVDVDGDTLTGSSYAGGDSTLYNFYYDNDQRVTLLVHDSINDAVLSAQAEGPQSAGPAYLIGTTLIAGHEEAKVTRYARILADETGEPVLSYDKGRAFPPEIIYNPG